jgi:hypothetical protein
MAAVQLAAVRVTVVRAAAAILAVMLAGSPCRQLYSVSYCYQSPLPLETFLQVMYAISQKWHTTVQGKPGNRDNLQENQSELQTEGKTGNLQNRLQTQEPAQRELKHRPKSRTYRTITN